MTDDLKPCPFCGGEPFSFEDYGHSTAWEVGCSNSQCRVEPHVWEKTKDEAIASWNTRTKTKAEMNRIEALTAEVAAHKGNADANYSKWVEADAKLAKCLERNALLEARLGKAVELLRRHCDPMDMSDADVATLAEIEGEKT